jgi:SAM-dependent methyltransferase
MENFDVRMHLLCPDCHGKIELEQELLCKSCGRVYGSKNDAILDLQPKILSEPEIAAEKFWATDAVEGVAVPPLRALLHKADSICYFEDQVMPGLRLNGNILEIGSGSCWLSSLLKLSFPKAYVVATDVSHSALRKGIQISNFLGSRIDCFASCRAEQLPFEDRIFDYVIGSAMLVSTELAKATEEVFRVLKNKGSYIGIGELAIPHLLGTLWGSQFGSAGRAERKHKVRYANYSLNDWKFFFRNAGFKEVSFKDDRDPNYKRHSFFSSFYYTILAPFPEPFFKRCFAYSLDISARKNV